ncbi:uncharacterized protein [Cicer arietinum]|uniref:uncharacterized protein n=1 Tax=Cicer arietinum TaxID=3827 RepID=UPI003CC62339
MRSLLGTQEVFEIVQDGYEQLGANPTERQQTTFKDCKKRNCKALFYIWHSVDSNNYERISKVSTSKEAWNILVKYCTGGEKTKKIKLQMLRRKYELLQMENNEKMTNYFNRVQTITNQMKANGEVMTEVVIIEMIMMTQTQRYDHIVVAIEESKNLDIMKLEDLQSSLEAHEFRVKERDEAHTQTQALQAQFSKKSNQDGMNAVPRKYKEMIVKFNCPRIVNNLLSLGQLLEKGYSMNMENGQMKVFDSAKRLILKAPLSKNRTFKIEIQINENQRLAGEIRREDWLWHQRFGHLNFRNLQMLQSSDMVIGIQEIQVSNEICEE